MSFSGVAMLNQVLQGLGLIVKVEFRPNQAASHPLGYLLWHKHVHVEIVEKQVKSRLLKNLRKMSIKCEISVPTNIQMALPRPFMIIKLLWERVMIIELHSENFIAR